MSEVKRWWANWHMQEYVANSNGQYVLASDFDAALAREAALREELARKDVVIEDMVESNCDMAQFLAVAEQRNADLSQTLKSAVGRAARKWFYESFDGDLLELMQKAGLIAQAEGFSLSVIATLQLDVESAIDAALNPTESGASDAN